MASYLEVIVWEVRAAVHDVICHWADRKLFMRHAMARPERRDFRCRRRISYRAVEAVRTHPDR